MQELGAGLLENVYKNALHIAMKEKELNVWTEKTFEIDFRGRKVGRYHAEKSIKNQLSVNLQTHSDDWPSCEFWESKTRV